MYKMDSDARKTNSVMVSEKKQKITQDLIEHAYATDNQMDLHTGDYCCDFNKDDRRTYKDGNNNNVCIHSEQSEKNECIRKICNRLGLLYSKWYNKAMLGFNYYCYKQTGKFVCFLSRGLLMQVSEDSFRNYGNKYDNHATLRVKYVTIEDNVVMVVSEKGKTIKFRPQFGFLSKCKDIITTPFVLLDTAKQHIAKITSQACKLLFIDIVSMLLNIRDGFFTATKLVSILMQLYTIHTRYMNLFGNTNNNNFTRQAGANMTDLLVGFGMLGLPAEVMNALKNFSALTGKKIFESELLLDLGEKLFESLIVIIRWIANPLGTVRLISEENTEFIVTLVTKLGTSVFMHKDIKVVCDIYTRYVTNPQVLFDPSFRQEIIKTHDRLKASAVFMDYVQNGNNKYFLTTWNLFESNVVKSCNAFDTSGRDEPICFVFEGEAGSGKSCIMNMFVNLLRESGKTTICHSVPAAEDGKDFYDDYENQEVFVMDDVGQQGKSQWRYLINYVSPVKYPLPCATASKKNTKFFNSKIILCTTNHFMDLGGFTSSDCITEPEALYRRAHVIRIDRGNTPWFSQVLKYYKYDHIGSKKWENDFINHFSVNRPEGLTPNFSTDDEARDDNTIRILTWLYTVFLHIVKSEENNSKQMVVAPQDLRNIITTAQRSMEAHQEEYFDAQKFDFISYVSRLMCKGGEKVVDYYSICQEFVSYYTNMILQHMQEAANIVSDCVLRMLPTVSSGIEACASFFINSPFMRGVLLYLVLGFAAGWFFGEKEVSLPTPEFNETTVKKINELKKHEVFGPQSDGLNKDYEQWLSNVKKHCKTLVVKHDNNALNDEHTQCVVSGKRILLPSHLEVGDKFVDIYQSWRHYKEGHVEIEGVQLKLIKKYVLSDLAVYEIKGTIPLYKLNRQIFANSATSSKNWFLINSAGHLPVVYDVDVKRNDEKVSYSSFNGKWNHDKDTGFYTPYSASGACGTILAAPGVGIIGFHVAGSPSMGFCVQPPNEVMSEIRDLMLNAPHAEGFDLDTKIIPNFSGVRVRYEQPIEQTRTLGKTSLVPSKLHVDYCEEMAQLVNDIEEKPIVYTDTPLEKIDVKSPPNFLAKGTPAKTLKHLSQKTFMRQGRISQEEVEFMKSYLRTIMVPFDDLTDYETAFGGDNVPALNKDSSNGYGCAVGKEAYFDFEKKEIKPNMIELIEKVREEAKNGKYDYNLFMCRETLKDELRKSTKVNEPRTFRVMPLGHMWWTKKIFGKLLNHFKNTRMETGISVGYNPYVDADELAKKLLMCETTGDADFGKWDGTIMAAMIRLITDVMAEFYEGEHPYMIEWLTNTIANSFVLVNDEIWATTHGLPSGTWLTLLLNCLLNKCLTALVIFRYKEEPSVWDVHRVVDFVTGDDKVFGADAELSKSFNLLNIKAVAESLGMDCTNGDKTKIERVSQPFDKLTYVKRHFRKHPVLGKYVGCLSIDTIMNTLQWYNSDVEDVHEAMLGKMRSMQVEAYLHSPSFFRALTAIFNKNYPFDALFDEKKVLNILRSDEGYERVIAMQNKNFSF